MNKTSLLYWFPTILELGIPAPKTKWISISNLYTVLDGSKLPEKTEQEIIATAKEMGYPLFLRTDMMSGKHGWRRTCFVADRNKLFLHIFAVVEDNALKSWGDCDPSALVFREYIPLVSLFTAFDDLPIAVERRHFVKDGKVICSHPYWPKEAITESWKAPNQDNWHDLLAIMNTDIEGWDELLTTYSEQVSTALPGYWSVDYALSTTDKWYLIDMADGDRSWHPEHER